MSTFTLYRFYDTDDQLLYVGLTVNPGRRLSEHRAAKSWWTEVAHIDLEQYPSLATLRHAETAAITTEHPIHNIALNDTLQQPTNEEKRQTIEWLGWECISNGGIGTFVRPERPGRIYTRAEAWTQTQR